MIRDTDDRTPAWTIITLWNPDTHTEEIVARERIEDPTKLGTFPFGPYLDSIELSAADMGCEPGTEYGIELLNAEDKRLSWTIVEAR